MALFARSTVWPERMAHAVLDDTTLAAGRQMIAGAIRASRALTGYSLLTGLGLLLGFVREMMVASTFGLSTQLDVFVAVMTVQLFFGAQIGNALETAFISRIAGRSEAGAVLRSVKPAVYGLLCVNAGVVLCLWGGGSWLLKGLFPRFDAGQQALATQMLHIFLLPIVCASTAGVLRAALSVMGAFVPGFMAGSIVSVCTILSIGFFSSALGIDALTVGVAVGNLAVLGFFLGRLALLRHDAGSHTLKASSAVKPDGWFMLWGAAATVLLGELVYAGVGLTERSLASRLPAGSLAAFFYASTIVSVPLSLVVVPLTTMVFPRMVEAFGRDIRAGVEQIRTHGLLLVIASIAVMLIVIPYAQTIVETVFMRGRFSAEHARLTASILSVTVMALPFMSLSRLVRNASYALSDYRAPAVGMGAQVIALGGLGLIFVPRFGAQGLAVAMVAGEAAGLLAMGLRLRMRLRSI